MVLTNFGIYVGKYIISLALNVQLFTIEIAHVTMNVNRKKSFISSEI